MVAFESLALDGVEVAKHMGIEEEGQSVDLVEKPSPGNPKTGLAQTGDTNKVLPLVCLAVVATLVAALAALYQRKGNGKESGGDAKEARSDEEDSEEEDSKNERTCDSE